MLYVLVAIALVLAFGSAVAAWWSRARRRAKGPPPVIYLGYDNRDGVRSMRAALLKRLERGDLDLS